MKNENNTNTAAALDEIMRNAHKAAAETVSREKSLDYRVTLSAALSESWKKSRLDGMTARQAWESMNGEEQHNALLKMAYYCKRKDNAGTDKAGNKIAPVMDWTTCRDDMETIVNEAYIIVVGHIDIDKPLAIIMYRAIFSAARRIKRAEIRNARAIKYDAYTDDDGNTNKRDYIINNAAPIGQRPISPEQAAIIRDTLDNIAADDIDRAIIRLRVMGLNQREIAAELNMASKTSVEKRLAKMKERRDNAENK